jgi:hypothetical protein
MPVDQRLVWGGIAVGGAGIAVYMYRKNQKQKAASAAAAATPTGAGNVNTTAGMAYGYSMYGYGGGLQYTSYGYGFGPYGLGAYGGGAGEYNYGFFGAGVNEEVPTQATTNAQWSQAAMTALGAAGYSGTTVLAALGQYLLGGQLTSDQQGIVTAAIASEGYPPVPGASGYPPAMNTSAPGGQTTTTQTAVPQITGMSAGNAHNAIVAAKLIPVADPNQKATDTVTGSSPGPGSSVAQGTRVTIFAKSKTGVIT